MQQSAYNENKDRQIERLAQAFLEHESQYTAGPVFDPATYCAE
jgi:hypothetical protein